jgi:transposase
MALVLRIICTKSGCRWCDCLPQYGPPTTIYNRFVRWARRGLKATAGKVILCEWKVTWPYSHIMIWVSV